MKVFSSFLDNDGLYYLWIYKSIIKWPLGKGIFKYFQKLYPII